MEWQLELESVEGGCWHDMGNVDWANLIHGVVNLQLAVLKYSDKHVLQTASQLI